MAKGKSEEWRTPDGLLLLKGWARDGLTDEQIARRMGIHPSTLYDYKNKFNEITEAIKEGRKPEWETVLDTAYKAAEGYWVEETDTEIIQSPDGTERRRIMRRKRWIKPEPALVCYILNNRKGEFWSNRPVIEAPADMEDDGLTLALQEVSKGIFDGGDDGDMIPEDET